MTRRFAHAMRLVLPRTWTVVLFLSIWLSVELLGLYIAWRYADIARQEFSAFFRTRDAIVAMGAFLYGVSRATSRNPYYQAEYRHWLELTPWTVDKPLPIGPLQLVWQDVVVLAALAAMMFDADPASRWNLLSRFAVGFSLPTIAAFIDLDLWKHAYASIFLVGLGVRLHPWPWPRLAVIAALFLVLRHGVNVMLRSFPWGLEGRMPGVVQQVRLALNGQGVRSIHGWPHGVLAPPILNCLRISYRDGVMASLLTGWMLYAACAHLPMHAHAYAAKFMLGVFLPPCIGGRLLRYVVCHWPPQSRIGMILRGRPITPGFDIVFVAPLLTLVMSVATVLVLYQYVHPVIAGPAAVTVALLITLNAGPTYLDWALTGDHRTGFFGSRQWLKKL